MPIAKLVADRSDDGFITHGKLTIDGFTTEFTATTNDLFPIYSALKGRGYAFADEKAVPEFDSNSTVVFDVVPRDSAWIMTQFSLREAIEALHVAGVTADQYAECIGKA